jgi:diguanylate cyclase (GGDEF)-like protein
LAILVINRNSEEVSEIDRVLREGGFVQVQHAASIEEAYEMLGIEGNHIGLPGIDVELILMEMMEELAGAQACRKIREFYQYADLPVIILSETLNQEALQLAFAFGAADFLTKPVREFELLARIRSALRLKHEIDRRKARERELLEVTRQLGDVNSVLTRLSYIDSLTNTANRRCFDNTLGQEWRRAARTERIISMLMIDVDYFKRFNDTYGHQAGDECLKAVASALKLTIRRPGDLLARYGGEEFAVILPETPLVGAESVAESLRKSIEDLKIAHRQSSVSPYVTISIGAACIFPKRTTPSQYLTKGADDALYEAKEAGRNSFRAIDLTVGGGNKDRGVS